MNLLHNRGLPATGGVCRPASPQTRRLKPGFALVVTISLMVLLMILAVGLLSLSAIVGRTGSRQALKQEARTNARLSLLVAIGELQRLAGPDQRVTAPAAILDQDPATETSDGIARPHLTGVWKGWKWLDGDSADYSERKREDFLGWLVSEQRGPAGPDAAGALEDPEYVKQPADEDAIELVGTATADAGEDHVRASLVDIDSGSPFQGGMAWAVFDEAAKARVALPDPNRDDLSSRLAELAAPSVPGFASVGDAEHDWQSLADLGEDRLKLVSFGQTGLAELESHPRDFHHLTSDSLGLAVNVAEGGLASDLSLLFDHPGLPDEFERRFLYSDQARPLANPPARFRGAHPMPAPDPSWRLLHSHARLHELVDDAAGTPTVGTRVVERPPAGITGSRALFHPGFNEQQLAPVIAKAQFIFSLGFAASPNQSRGQNQPGAAAGENWIVWLVTDPVVTLWNPYDVNLTFDQGRIDLYRVPMAFQIYRNGQTFTSGPTLFANAYLPGEFNTRAERYYRLNIKPAIDSRGREDGRVTMKPGEHLVFTAHNHVKHYREAYFNEGVDLRPGWNPPAGQASNKYVGGISSLNVCVDQSGNSSARINGVTSRVIPVKAGDRIQLRVTPAHANVDRMAETDNREISAYLKYYMASSDRASASTPPFVGAIEVDLGRDERELLGSFDQRDLPTMIVPAGLPPQQGDNYVGTDPPPAVRVKEPFLIASLNLKTEKDSRFPARCWLHNSPTNLFASMGLDQTEKAQFHQYEFSWQPMTDWASTPTIEIDTLNRGYGAAGLYAQSGVTQAPFASVPVAPLISMAQLRHAPVNFGGQLPLQAQVIGNSFAHPLLPATEPLQRNGDRTFIDHSFHANNALFDRYFFSSASTQRAGVFAGNRGLEEVLTGFLQGGESLPNPRMRPFRPQASDAESIATELADPESGFSLMGAHLGIEGAFNVNSTSVAAWKAVLASLQPPENPAISLASGELGRTSGDGILASRHLPPTGEQLDGTTDPLEGATNTWAGHRRLDDEQLDELARELVSQVKQRGPFQSLAEFVNRRLADDELGLAGALQAAIDASAINDEATAGGDPLDADPDTAHPEAAIGSTSDGAPAVINQGDLLTPLAPILTARADTFKIRAYGEAKRGTQTARAWCEAVVQRTPGFVDGRDEPETPLTDLDPAAANARFGRRFVVVSFRWLSAEEI